MHDPEHRAIIPRGHRQLDTNGSRANVLRIETARGIDEVQGAIDPVSVDEGDGAGHRRGLPWRRDHYLAAQELCRAPRGGGGTLEIDVLARHDSDFSRGLREPGTPECKRLSPDQDDLRGLAQGREQAENPLNFLDAKRRLGLLHRQAKRRDALRSMRARPASGAKTSFSRLTSRTVFSPCFMAALSAARDEPFTVERPLPSEG